MKHDILQVLEVDTVFHWHSRIGTRDYLLRGRAVLDEYEDSNDGVSLTVFCILISVICDYPFHFLNDSFNLDLG